MWRPELAIAGLIAGLLTIRPPVPLGADGEVDYLTGGVWFGLLLAAYFFVFQRDRSIGKALSITAVSTAALWIAFWSTLFAYGRFRAPSSGEHAPPVPVVAWFVGGVIGAFIVSTTTFLYGTSREAVWKKILFLTISGGLLGIAGHEAGTIPMLGALAPQSDTTPSILFVIWQTGVGFVMGLVWPGTVIEKAAVPPRGLPVPIVAKAFMIVVVAPLAYAVTSTTWFRDQEPQIGAARVVYLAGRPRSTDFRRSRCSRIWSSLSTRRSPATIRRGGNTTSGGDSNFRSMSIRDRTWLQANRRTPRGQTQMFASRSIRRPNGPPTQCGASSRMARLRARRGRRRL